MTIKLIIEDVIVGCAVLLLLQLYGESLRRRWISTQSAERSERRLRRLRRCSMGYIAVLMAIGILHQTGVLYGSIAFCIFAIVLVIGIIGWQWVHRAWRS